MKILYIANPCSIHTVRWVNALAGKKHEVHLIYKYDDHPKDNIISDKVFLHRLKYSGVKGYFLNAKKLSKLYKEIKPDIINAHYASGYGTLARLAKVRPLVLSVWGSDVYDFPFQSSFKMKLVIKNLLYADQIASTSKCMADQVRKILSSSSIDIKVTPFGVDLEKFEPKNEYKENDIIRIGNIKTLAPKYGITDLVKSIRLLIDRLIEKGIDDVVNKLEVDIYGDGVQKAEISQLIQQLQLTDIIKLKGKIPNSEVPFALNSMDIFCVASENESFGVSVVEAMAMGLPVVATDVDGFKEVVEDGKTGIIVNKKNPDSISKGLEKLILDKKLRERMGSSGRRKVEECYNWNENVNAMIEIYENIRKK